MNYLQIFWMSDLPPLPASRLFKATPPTPQNKISLLQLSKSSTSLVPLKKPDENQNSHLQIKAKESGGTKYFSTELKVFENNNNTVSQQNGQPTFGDYENYFYI